MCREGLPYPLKVNVNITLFYSYKYYNNLFVH